MGQWPTQGDEDGERSVPSRDRQGAVAPELSWNPGRDVLFFNGAVLNRQEDGFSTIAAKTIYTCPLSTEFKDP